MKRIFTLFIALAVVFAAAVQVAAIEFKVVVPTPTYQVWVVGNFNGWNNNQHKLNKIDDTHYSLTIPDDQLDGKTAADIKYKYLSGGGDWAYVEKGKTGEEISDRNYPGVGANDTVRTWALVFNPNVAAIEKDVKVDVYVPKAVKECYLTGSHTSWASPGSEGTKMDWIEAESDASGNLFRKTIHTLDANKLIYKFASGPSWVYEQDSSDLKMPDVTQNDVFHFMPKFKRIYPGAANLKTITINVTAPAGTDSVFIMGSHLGWNGSSWTPGVKNQNGTFTFTVQNVDLIEYKFYKGRNWSFEEKKADMSGMDNRKADAQVALIFNDVIAAWLNTGVKGLDMDNYRVSINNSAVTVEGVNNKVEMFDIAGRMIQSANLKGTFSSKAVNAGIYILKVDGATLKVMVK
jgi:hypothetical protein